MKRLKNLFKHKRLLFEIILIIIILNNKIVINHLEKQKQKIVVYNDEVTELNDLQSENETLKTSLDDIQSENEALKTSLDDLQSENEALKFQKYQKNDNYKILFDDIFWDIGRYIPKEKNSFYNSPSCSKKVNPDYFLSTRWIQYDMENSYWVYAYSSNLGVVWATEEVTFNKIRKNQ